MINIKNFDPNFLNIDKMSLTNSDDVTYYIKYITMNEKSSLCKY